MANNQDFKVKNGIKPTVYHEAVGTVVSESVAYNLAAASYDSVSFSVTAEGEVPSNIFFKPDGTKMYVVGNGGDAVNEYNLSTAWDISTSSFVQTFSVATQETNPFGLFFKPDGTKMYVVGAVGDDVNEYNLSTAWDISTASYSQLFSVATEETNPSAIFFKNDGTKMYILGATGDDVNEYNLSTAWDISTASYSQLFSVATEDTGPRSLFIKPDGTSMFILGSISDTVYEYTLSTAWDISTASLYSSFAVTAQTANPSALFFNSDGTKMYISDFITYDVLQYSTVSYTQTLDLSTGSVFELTPTSDTQVSLSNPATSGVVSGATLLLGAGVSGYSILANPGEQGPTSFGYPNPSFPVGFAVLNSGSYFFIGDGAQVEVHRYNLSNAYDSTELSGSPNQTLARPSQIAYNEGRGWYMSPDGTHMYYARRTGTASTSGIWEYSLSTPYDLTTTSFVRSGMVNYTPYPNGLYFSYDGTRAYMSDESMYSGNTIFYIRQFNLSTPWNISSFSSNAFVCYNSSNTSLYPCYGPRGLSFSTDGKYFYTEGQSSGKVYEWECSTPWNITTASYKGNSVSTLDLHGGTSNNAYAMYVAQNTDYLYVGSSNDVVSRSRLGVNPTITYDTSIQWAGGTAPTSPAIGDTDVLTFSTRDGGTTYNAALAIDGAQ